MNVNRQHVESWLSELKSAWEAGDPNRALRLFEQTVEYYERPFSPGTSMEDFKTYWQDIVGLADIVFEYDVVAVDGPTACVKWVNRFRSPDEEKDYHLDGVFIIEFDDGGNCKVFRQWWFQKE